MKLLLLVNNSQKWPRVHDEERAHRIIIVGGTPHCHES